MALSSSEMVTVTGFFTAALVAWNSYQGARRDKKIESIKKTGEATHTLSNSAMGAQLKLNVEFAQSNAVILHRMADYTKTEGDAAAALAADVKLEAQKVIYQAHLVQQAKVDATEAEANK
jgi:hypothetical protein